MEKVEICIPAFNEEDVIIPTLDKVLVACDELKDYNWNVIVVDNNSNDKTAELVSMYPDSRVNLHFEAERGKGAAVRSAAQKSTSDIFIYLDADLSASPENIAGMLGQLKDGRDIVAGSRFADVSTVKRSAWRTSLSKLFKAYADTLVPVPTYDSQCGLKVMNQKATAVLAECEHNGWFFDREFLAKATKRELQILETPVSWDEFVYPGRKSKLNVIKDGLRSLRDLWLIRQSVKKFR